MEVRSGQPRYMKSLNEEDDHSTEPKVDAKSDQSKWYHVDPSMMASKSSYFFQNAKDACYLPYMILFLSNIGLTAAQAGTNRAHLRSLK